MKGKHEVRYITPSDVRVLGENQHEFVLSTEAMDRHGTIIPIEEWNLTNYNKNGVVLLQHGRNWSVDSVLGSGTIRVEDGKLILTVDYDDREYNEVAWKVQKKVEKGSLRATSVGFIANSYEWRKVDGQADKVLILKDCELLEASIVDIPSNPEALKRGIDISDYPDTEKVSNEQGDRSAKPYIYIHKFLKHRK